MYPATRSVVVGYHSHIVIILQNVFANLFLHDTHKIIIIRVPYSQSLYGKAVSERELLLRESEWLPPSQGGHAVCCQRGRETEAKGWGCVPCDADARGLLLRQAGGRTRDVWREYKYNTVGSEGALVCPVTLCGLSFC